MKLLQTSAVTTLPIVINSLQWQVVVQCILSRIKVQIDLQTHTKYPVIDITAGPEALDL